MVHGPSSLGIGLARTERRGPGSEEKFTAMDHPGNELLGFRAGSARSLSRPRDVSIIVGLLHRAEIGHIIIHTAILPVRIARTMLAAATLRGHKRSAR
jgi:hypothetical protein